LKLESEGASRSGGREAVEREGLDCKEGDIYGSIGKMLEI